MAGWKTGTLPGHDGTSDEVPFESLGGWKSFFRGAVGLISRSNARWVVVADGCTFDHALKSDK